MHIRTHMGVLRCALHTHLVDHHVAMHTISFRSVPLFSVFSLSLPLQLPLSQDADRHTIPSLWSGTILTRMVILTLTKAALDNGALMRVALGAGQSLCVLLAVLRDVWSHSTSVWLARRDT